MQPTRGLNICAQEGSSFFFSLGVGNLGNTILYFFVFPPCSPRVFPIAPHFYPIWFAQSSSLLTYDMWAEKHGFFFFFLSSVSLYFFIYLIIYSPEKHWQWHGGDMICRRTKKNLKRKKIKRRKKSLLLHKHWQWHGGDMICRQTKKKFEKKKKKPEKEVITNSFF